MRKNTFAAVGVFGSEESFRSTAAIHSAAGSLRARVSHAAERVSAEVDFERRRTSVAIADATMLLPEWLANSKPDTRCGHWLLPDGPERWRRESLLVAITMTFLLHAWFNLVGAIALLVMR